MICSFVLILALSVGLSKALENVTPAWLFG